MRYSSAVLSPLEGHSSQTCLGPSTSWVETCRALESSIGRIELTSSQELVPLGHKLSR